MSKKKYTVLVVGGGYGGVKAALELAKHPDISVTLVSDYDHMRFYSSLYMTATGGPKKIASIPFDELFEYKRITFIQDTVEKLDRAKLYGKRQRQMIDQAAAEGTRMGLLFLDLDHFKEVNDLLGHDAGDALFLRAATLDEIFH